MCRYFFFIAAILFLGCDINNHGDPAPSTFIFKFINTGVYPITAFFLKPVSDTANWGTSILPVAQLDTLEYVLFNHLEKGNTYAFRVQFDSLGVAAYLKHSYMPTSPDTITGQGALGPGGWTVGHNWGLITWPGEKNVTPKDTGI